MCVSLPAWPELFFSCISCLEQLIRLSRITGHHWMRDAVILLLAMLYARAQRSTLWSTIAVWIQRLQHLIDMCILSYSLLCPFSAAACCDNGDLLQQAVDVGTWNNAHDVLVVVFVF